jgi:hypothetical protein
VYRKSEIGAFFAGIRNRSVIGNAENRGMPAWDRKTMQSVHAISGNDGVEHLRDLYGI